MSSELFNQIKELTTGLYVMLALIAISLIFIAFLVFCKYFYENQDKSTKIQNKELKEKLENKLIMDRLRYEHEEMYKNWKELNK